MTRSAVRSIVVCLAASLIAVSCQSEGGCSSGERSESSEASDSGEKDPSSEEESTASEDAESQSEQAGLIPDDVATIAHRGARALKPENTLPSFEIALDHRADVIELDLHLSKDGDLVVWHDPFIRSSKCKRPDSAGQDDAEELPAPAPDDEDPERTMVRNLTTAQLARYDCSNNPEPEAFPNQNSEPTALARDNFGIVTLDAFFEFVKQYAASEKKTAKQKAAARKVEFLLEIKRHPDNPTYIGDDFDGSKPGKMERKLVEHVRKRGALDHSTVQCFHAPSLWVIHELEPDIGLSLAETERSDPHEQLAKRGATHWSPKESIVEKEDVREAHDAELKVIPWTVNEPAKIRRLVDLGVDGIITDDPTL